MNIGRKSLIVRYIAAGTLLLSPISPAIGQVRAQVQQVPQPTPSLVEASVDARQTQEDFRELLAKHPPSLGRVLKLDPSLMTNDAYLATYPALATFLKQHPEVARNPHYFLDFVAVSLGEYRQPSEGVRMWEEAMQSFTIVTVMAIILGVLYWLIKTVVEQRRWSRQTKIQTEVHTKLFDRLSSNEDLLAYIQSPAGRRFLDAAPLPPAQPRPVGAPISRILWSVQAGIVIVAAALGMLFISGRVIEEVAQPLFAMATIGIALGIGFVVSSAVAYVLSKNMGLIESSTPGSGTESNV